MIKDSIMMSAIKPLYPDPQPSYKDTLSCKYSLSFPHSSENMDIHHSVTVINDEICHLVNCDRLNKPKTPAKRLRLSPLKQYNGT